MSLIPKICEELEQASRLLVASHQNPEGDAIGSSLAILHHFPEKKIEVFNADPLPYFLEFLPASEKIIHKLDELSWDYELALVLDCAHLERVEKDFARRLQGIRIINIDHHQSNCQFGELNLVEAQASSTGEILYQLFSHLGRPISRDTATCLYTAIMMDTGSFRYINTTPASLEIAFQLAKLGANPAYIARQVYENHPPARLLLLAQTLQTLKFGSEGRRAEIVLTQEMFKKAGASPSMAEGFINYLTSVRGVEVAILFRELELGRYKVSFRSQGKVNVAKLAEELGGGGHFQASGATLEGKLEEIQALVRKKVDELIAQVK